MPLCRLCHSQVKPLRISHIVPKMFYNVIKEKAPTGYMRQSVNPNVSMQDGLKVPFLCNDCEELFSKYESEFAKRIYTDTVSKDGLNVFESDNDSLAYFLLSVAWRNMQYTSEVDNMNLTEKEKLERNRILEQWRLLLLDEKKGQIRKIQQFIVPTKNLIFFQSLPRRVFDNVLLGFKTLDEENVFNFAFSLVQVPYFLFITTVWGKTGAMKQYKLGKIIKPRKSELPQNIITVLNNNHIAAFEKARVKLSDKQKKTIDERVKAKLGTVVTNVL